MKHHESRKGVPRRGNIHSIITEAIHFVVVAVLLGIGGIIGGIILI